MKIAELSIIRWSIALVAMSTLAGCAAPLNSLTAAGVTFPYPDYAPLPDSVVKLDEDLIEKID